MKRAILILVLILIPPVGSEACQYGLCICRQPTTQTVVHYGVTGRSFVELRYYDTNGNLYATLGATQILDQSRRARFVGFLDNKSDEQRVIHSPARAEFWDNDRMLFQMMFPSESRLRLPRMEIEPREIGSVVLEVKVAED